jgi:hypothetical protein
MPSAGLEAPFPRSNYGVEFLLIGRDGHHGPRGLHFVDTVPGQTRSLGGEVFKKAHCYTYRREESDPRLSHAKYSHLCQIFDKWLSTREVLNTVLFRPNVQVTGDRGS